MSPRTEQQYKTIRVDKINLILQTALQLFARDGYVSTSVSSIAKEAGISKGLMYNYFDSKEELLKELMLGGFDELLDLLDVQDETNVKKQEIIDFIDGNLNLLKQKPDYFKLYFSLLFQPKVFNLLNVEFYQHFDKTINHIVNYYKKNDADNSYMKARYLLAVFDGVGLHYVSDSKSFPLDEVRNMMVDLL